MFSDLLIIGFIALFIYPKNSIFTSGQDTNQTTTQTTPATTTTQTTPASTTTTTTTNEINTTISNEIACWKDAQLREGVIAKECAQGQELNGLLCYPNCTNGYYGEGPVCWETCKANYTDAGVFCAILTDIYGKGCCCFFGYCCHNCRVGYTDDGCTCRRPGDSYTKDSYVRGAGIVPSCPSNKEKSGGLCYTPCPQGYKGFGPVCWKKCNGTLSYECGALCTNSSETCQKIVEKQILSPLQAFAAFTNLDNSNQTLALIAEAAKNITAAYLITCKN